MTPQEAAEILKRHNEWRRADSEDSDLEMQPTKLIGQAIDVLVAYVESQT
jgi:hypothetical protein